MVLRSGQEPTFVSSVTLPGEQVEQHWKISKIKRDHCSHSWKGQQQIFCSDCPWFHRGRTRTDIYGEFVLHLWWELLSSVTKLISRLSTRWVWPACSTRGSSTAAPPSSPPLHLPSSSGTRWGSENTFVLLTFINITSKMTQSCQVYTQMGVARSWGESREECRFVAIQEEVFCDFLSMSWYQGWGRLPGQPGKSEWRNTGMYHCHDHCQYHCHC